MTNNTIHLKEEILDADLNICDSHHHLLHLPDGNFPEYISTLPSRRYLLAELLDDIGKGHNIGSTIYANASSFYRADGPEAMRPLGETEFANGIAAMSASGRYGHARVCSGIVAYADLRAVDVGNLLLAHKWAGGNRVRGIRQSGAFDPTNAAPPSPGVTSEGLYLRADFRAGFAMLEELNLTFDAYLYHPQLSDIVDLARAFPRQIFILDHVGAPIGRGIYAGKRREIFEIWRRSMQAVATCENVNVKLGGLGMWICGFDLGPRETVNSIQISAAWRPYIETCIELFGVDRCMFESNFPMDKYTCSYDIIWNTFKNITINYSESEKFKLYRENAFNIYGI